MVNLSIPGLLLLSAYSLNSASAGDVYEISSGNPPDIEPTSTSLETNVVTNYIPEPNADSESVHVEIQEHDNINPQDACDSEPLEQMDSDTRVLPESLDEGVPHQFSRLGHHSDMASDINDEEPSFKIGENDIIQPPWEDTAPYHSIDDEELDNLMRLTAQETSDDHEEGNGKLNTNKSEKTERKSHDTQTPQEIYEELDNLLRLTAQEIYEERKEGHGKPNTNKSEKAERKSHDTQTTQEICEECEEGHDKINKNKSGNAGIKSYDTQTPQETSDAHEEGHDEINTNKSEKAERKSHDTQTTQEICEECEEGHDKINKNKSGNAGIKSYDTQTPQETSDAHEEEHGNLNKNKSGKAGIKSHNTQTPLKKKDFCKEGCHGCNNKPEDNERDPSSPDDDGGCECGMTNHFVFDYKTTLLLKSLKTETSTHYYIAMAAIFTISLFPCMFKAFRAIISHKLRKNGSNAKLALSMFLSFIFSLIILTLDYGLMLLAMTFNVGYFFAIIIGSSLSYTMFGLLFDSPCDCGGKKAILSDCCG
ncbi:BMN1-20 [Babesia microti strain RI]|uniref:BMN1-20 n=2 Tax=Babesia microti TaxID=5868 RepID=I7J5Q4_BABMR|nr:BMN1-20 [Babesia microti strain RI]CCF73112.1 BMN1-20 [Babesia microti strain RI]|eukprot:XP_012647721.1 BMN1-20 [Babesia microti strain RI]